MVAGAYENRKRFNEKDYGQRFLTDKFNMEKLIEKLYASSLRMQRFKTDSPS